MSSKQRREVFQTRETAQKIGMFHMQEPGFYSWHEGGVPKLNQNKPTLVPQEVSRLIPCDQYTQNSTVLPLVFIKKNSISALLPSS